MTKLTSEEMMEAKQAFEHFAKQHGVCILHTTATTDNLQTMPTRIAAVQRGSNSPSERSTPTSKMALQKRPSGTFERVHGSSSFMHAKDGRPPSTWPFGHMPSGALFTSQYFTCFGGWYLKA
jgi:hypothetical protein